MGVTSFISVVGYYVYITHSRVTQFCSLLYQDFEKNVKDPDRFPEPLIQNSEGAYAHFYRVQIITSRKKARHIKHNIDNQAQ